MICHHERGEGSVFSSVVILSAGGLAAAVEGPLPAQCSGVVRQPELTFLS